MTKDESFNVTGRITEFLDDAIKAIARFADRKKRPLDLDEQYAVRILRSRQRKIWHEHDSRFDDDEIERRRAALALRLNDNGDLLTYANISHARGRLDCHGCDFIYAGPVKEPQCRLCRVCAKGVEHVRTLFGPAEYRAVVGALTIEDGKIVRYLLCDECRAETLVPVEE